MIEPNFVAGDLSTFSTDMQLTLNKRDIESALESVKQYSIENTRLKGEVEKANIEIAKQTDIISTLKSEIDSVNGVIDNLVTRRYTNETAVIALLEQAELYTKKQELATLGVADAQEFVNDAVEGGIDDYDKFFGKIQDINNEMGTNKNAFAAWQETIKTAISSEVQAGVDLEADVSNRVKQWQTQLMGISDFTGEGETAGVDDFVNKLQLASDVTFGTMRAEVDNFVRTQEDRDNGLNTSSTEVIEALGTQYTQLGFLNDQLGTAKTALATAEDGLVALGIAIGDNEKGLVASYELMDTAILSSADILEKFAERVSKIQLPDTIGGGGAVVPWTPIDTSRGFNDILDFYTNTQNIN